MVRMASSSWHTIVMLMCWLRVYLAQHMQILPRINGCLLSWTLPAALQMHVIIGANLSCPCSSTKPDSRCIHACRVSSRLRPDLELQTGRGTAWQPYQPLQLPLQPLAYNITPRQQIQLAELHSSMAESFVDMTCVLIWAGPSFAGNTECVISRNSKAADLLSSLYAICCSGVRS